MKATNCPSESYQIVMTLKSKIHLITEAAFYKILEKYDAIVASPPLIGDVSTFDYSFK